MNPLKNIYITSPYGPRTHPISGRPSFHNGIDLRANYVPIVAVLDGYIDFARDKDEKSLGKYIRLNCGDSSFIYGHLSKVYVKQGQKVKEGDVIGVTGNTGDSTAPHLHFEIRKGEPEAYQLWLKDSKGRFTGSVDPLPFLRELEEKRKIPDVSDWAIDAYNWVKDTGISDGARPKDNVTREELWTMLYRFNKKGE